MFLYPFGDFHSLNLGWFLLQFKDWTEKIQEYLDNGGGTSENLANVIAPVFNAANTYAAGDYVLYNNELYKANQAVNPGTWDPDSWTQCLIVDEMGSGGAGVDNVARLMIAGQYSASFAYQKYGICRYNDKLWMANTDLPAGGEAWNPAHWDEITVGAGLTGLRRSVDTLSDAISNLNAAVNRIFDGNIIVVAKGTYGQYHTILAAVTAAVDGDLILVYPGTYTEPVEAWDKTLYIVGVDKNTCIIQNTTGNYATPAVEIDSGALMNFTIISDASNPTVSAGEDGYMTDYCIHVDNYHASGKELIIQNCIIRNNHRAALGIGLYNNNTVTVRNCDIWSGTPPQDLPNRDSNRRGAVYVHPRMATESFPDVRDQLFRMIDSHVSCDDILALYIGNPNIGLDMTGKINRAYLQFNGTSFFAKDSNGNIITYSRGEVTPPNFTEKSIVGGNGFTVSTATEDVYLKLHPASAGNNLYKLNNESYPETGTIEAEISSGTVSRNAITKASGVATFLFLQSFTTSVPATGNLAVIPKGFRPLGQAFFPVYYINDNDEVKYVIASLSGATGIISCYNPNGGNMKQFEIYGTYPVNETANI